MKKTFPTELVYHVFSLLIAFILVHSIYVTLVRPQARDFIKQETANILADPQHVPERSFYVVIKDYEQETCFVLMLWAFSILAYKGRDAYRQQKLLGQDLLQLPGSLPIGPEDTREIAKHVAALPGHLQGIVVAKMPVEDQVSQGKDPIDERQLLLDHHFDVL